MKHRKAQATGVATFIFLLALFMVAYVLLLPEKSRQELIKGTNTTEAEDEELVEGQVNLLYTSPGNVYTYEKNALTIPINSVSLYARIEEEVKELAAKVKVSKSWFSDKPETLTFNVDDKNSLEKLQLFFFVNSGEGTMYIKFNGFTVFEGELSSTDSPINLPVDRAKASNVITLGMVSGDFSGDSYTLSSVSVKQTSKSEKSTENRDFYMESGERLGLKKATFTYFINCLKIDPEEQGDLIISLNNRDILTEHVFCDAGTQTKTLSASSFIAGRNTLEFKINKGEYNIENIELELETKEKYYPQYNFELSDEDYEAFKDDTKEAFILFKFPNDNDRKKATVTINENQISFDMKDDSYQREISSYLERGTNYIKIIPKLDFEISSLKVYTTEKEE